MSRLALAAASLFLLAQTGSHASPSADVSFLPAMRVAAAFDKGMPLLETSGYKVHASRREAPGLAEVHTRDTDIIYVLQGTATVVTGGEAVDSQPLAGSTEEFRGTSVRGGRAQELVKGDVFVIPNGVPHQFTAVQGPFLYYVVKATAAGGSK